jgi:hypothetical protein
MERWDDEIDEAPAPRRTGRPKGVRNKTPEQRMLQNKLEDLYKRVEHMLDPETKTYLKAVIAGKVQIDPVKEAELLLRFMSLYTTAALTWALDRQEINQDLGKVIGEYRMGIKDLEDMKRKREELRLKMGENERLVDTTRKPAMARLEDIHRKHSA